MRTSVLYGDKCTLCGQVYSMETSVLYVDKCTLCGQVYSMWTSVLYADKCTLCGQVFSMRTSVLYVESVPHIDRYSLFKSFEALEFQLLPFTFLPSYNKCIKIFNFEKETRIQMLASQTPTLPKYEHEC